MKDPFPIPPWPALAALVEPASKALSLTTLPLHVHEIAAACVAYTVIGFVVAPLVSTAIFGQRYTGMAAAKRLSWNVHVVSLVQSVLINVLALWVMSVDRERASMEGTGDDDVRARVYGYTGAAGMIQALATGYFVWDLVVTAVYLPIFGVGMLAHAISAVTVYSFGFRPFVNFYGCPFILWELSTPFLNVHWFCDKLGLTGSSLQLYNGLALIFTFLCCRILYGTYQSARVFSDIWTALHLSPPANNPSNVFLFAQADRPVPVWLAIVYLGSNLTLNSLNFFWFIKMISTIRKRFEPQRATAAIAGRNTEKLQPLVNTVATGRDSMLGDGVSQRPVQKSQYPVLPTQIPPPT